MKKTERLPKRTAKPHAKHACPALLVHCIDFRFQHMIPKVTKLAGYNHGEFDRVSVAGGAGNFDILEHHTALSNKLHDSHTAILTIHEDCGAGAKKEDFVKACAIVKKTMKKIRCFYLKLNGTIEEIK